MSQQSMDHEPQYGYQKSSYDKTDPNDSGKLDAEFLQMRRTRRNFLRIAAAGGTLALTGGAYVLGKTKLLRVRRG